MFDNRQLATLILFGCLLLLGLATKPGRISLANAARSFWRVKVAATLFLYMVWLAGVHWLGAAVGIWKARLLGESIYWMVVAGFVPLFRMTEPRKRRQPFRSLMRDLVTSTVFLVFFLNLKPFDLAGELVLQVVLALLVGGQLIAVRKRRRQARRICEVLLLLVMLGMATYTVVWLVRAGGTVDWANETRKFFLPIWLTVGTFPYIYVFAFWDRYSVMFALLQLRREEDRPSRRAHLGLVLGLRGRLNDIYDFPRYSYLANGAHSLGDGWRVVQVFRGHRAAHIARKQSDAERLVRNAGVVGVDEQGRTLDRREFKETKDALLYIASCQVGWHDCGGYRADLLDVLGTSLLRQGLPAKHGITMSVDGQRWYAYRRTPSGRVLGIGALDEPCDQWFYEGDDPPTGYPARGRGWGRAAHDRGVDWHRST
jgi:hypothetical protein